MKKIIIGLFASAMLLASILPAIAGESVHEQNVTTQVKIASVDDPSTNWIPPVVKCKWEVTETSNQHDDDLLTDGAQVLPNPGGDKTIHFYAVIEENSGSIQSAYAYVYHPDRTFKYKVPLEPLDRPTGQAVWTTVNNNNPNVVEYNTTAGYNYDEVNLEINEYLGAKVYYGHADINYCQPAGEYWVGVRAFDGMTWSDTFWNTLDYLPTAYIAVDFSTINYGDAVTVCKNTWAEGNLKWGDDEPTVRNYGNVPVDIKIAQDDMQFARDSTGAWNVVFDARLGTDGSVVENIFPFVEWRDWDTTTITPDDAYSIGTLPLCTQEKLDFSIHIKEANPGAIYSGHMKIFAVQHGDPYDTPYATPDYNSITGQPLKQTMPPGSPTPP